MGWDQDMELVKLRTIAGVERVTQGEQVYAEFSRTDYLHGRGRLSQVEALGFNALCGGCSEGAAFLSGSEFQPDDSGSPGTTPTTEESSS